MIKQSLKHFAVSKSFWILFFSLLFSVFTKVYSYTDTTKNPILAKADKSKSGMITLEANITFPDVLTGNEEQTLQYIEKFATNRRAYLIRTYNRSKTYFPKVSAVLTKYNLPHELKVLLALESAFNGNAVSKAGAVGYWQIMDEVAKEYGLKYVPKQNKSIKSKQASKPTAAKATTKTAPATDDRKNFNKSTYVAARYLKDRSRNLDSDLLLMVASYNCGVGNVWEAMKKTGKADPNFWDIKSSLPAETQAYVMNFITLNVIFHNYDKFENNTLLFFPTQFKIDNSDGIKTEELVSSDIQK